MDLKTILQLVLGSILVICSIAIIIVIILQEGHQAGLGAITGGADTFFSKNKARSIDSFLARWTKGFAAVFILMVVALNVIDRFMA
ncbi:MAG: preprotein translocase subunit SecG [Clostridia bacterium]|nr:preprotein translocase subunit SecG [Clostridia bacterium]